MNRPPSGESAPPTCSGRPVQSHSFAPASILPMTPLWLSVYRARLSIHAGISILVAELNSLSFS
jgi:hypothetical protein